MNEKVKVEKKWTLYDACAVAEGFCGYEPSREELVGAWQYLVDTGACWNLQGWYGRTASALLEQGIILPANREVK